MLSQARLISHSGAIQPRVVFPSVHVRWIVSIFEQPFCQVLSRVRRSFRVRSRVKEVASLEPYSFWETLMDYDDNDAQCHNLKLVGEGRSKSSVLRPYDFPKFDLDDSLPVHLRFDSLVGIDVFLGIQNQEENQWIEDFSGASNGIEFSSSAAESCSISRINNVWSEATSSESVEMLLKSVRQEEMEPGEAVAKESNNFDELGCLTRQMEVNYTQDDRTGEYVMDSNVSIPQDEFLKNFPGLNLERDIPQIVESSQFRETKVSAPEDFSHIGPSAASDGCNTSTEVNLFVGGEYADDNGREAKFSFSAANFPGNEPLDSKTREDLYDRARLLDTFNCSASKLGTSQHQEGPINLESAGVSIEAVTCDGKEQNVSRRVAQTEIHILEQNMDEASIHTVESSLHFVSNVESASQGGAVDSSLDSVREPAGMPSKGKSELQGPQGSDKDVSFSTAEQPGKVDVEPLPVSSKISDPFRGGRRDGSPVDGLAQQANLIGSVNAGYCAGCGPKMDSVLELVNIQDDNQFEDTSEVSYEKNSDVSVNISKPSLISGDNSQLSIYKANQTSNNPGRESLDLAVLSSPVGPITEQAESGRVKYRLAASRADMQQPGDSIHCLTPVFHVSQQVFEENVAFMLANAGESVQDVSCVKEVQEGNGVKLPPDMDSGNDDALTVDHGLKTPSGKSAVADEVLAHVSEPEMASKAESVNNGPPGKSHNSTIMSDCTEEHRQPSQTYSPQADEGDRTATEISMDASLSSLKGCAQLSDEVEVKADVARDAAGALLSDTAGKSSLLGTEFCNATSISVPMEVAVAYSCSPCSNESDLHPSSHQQILQEDVTAGAAHPARNEEAVMKSVCENAPVQPSDPHRAACDSPTIISSSELTLIDNGDHGKGRGSETSNKLANNMQSISEDLKGKDALVDDSSFTFKVNSPPNISESENGRNWSPFPSVEMSKSSLVVERSTPAGQGITASCQSPRGSHSEMTRRTSKSTSERKGRRASGKGPSKENAKKVNHAKETSSEKSLGKGDKASNMSLYPLGSLPHAKLSEMQSRGLIELNNTKISSAVTVPTSNLPDLNFSALNNSILPSPTFQQPFTDMKQVQLRAQIFVYGSLIQGTAPDEACMVAAFGSSDGGRSLWEPVWRAAVERVRSQKSQSSADEAPLQPQSGTSGARAHDTSGKPGSHQSRLLPSPIGRASSKAAPGTIMNPIIPLSSPLWTIPTSSRDGLQSNGMQRGPIMDFPQVISALHPYQTPIRNLAGNTSWLSPGSISGAWIATPQTSASDASAQFSTASITETVKLTPVKDSAGPSLSGLKLVTSGPLVHTGVPAALFPGSSPLLDSVKGMGSSEQHSADPKPRKRKKVVSSKDLGPISVLSHARTEPVVASFAMTQTSSLVASTTPGCLSSKIDMNKSAGTVYPPYSVDHIKKGDVEAGKTVTCSEGTLSKVAEAKVLAEDAAALAVAAVSHSQGVWSQLAKQRKAGLTSEAEAKLASAAVAIAAAASVAKAAAAAAKVASDAALQAKLMADEAFLSWTGNSAHVETSFKGAHSTGKTTPASILNGDGVINESNSILVAAKEAAKRRIEAASDASKQAENLAAIIKAAELAAEAVSQAGKIVARGDPLPLRVLIEAGPEGYWKLPQVSSELAIKFKNREQIVTETAGGGADISEKYWKLPQLSSESAVKLNNNIGDQTFTEIAEGGADFSAKVSGNGMVDERDALALNPGKIPPPREMSNDSLNDHNRLVDGSTFIIPFDEQDLRSYKNNKAVEMAQSSEMVSELETASRFGSFQDEVDEVVDRLHENTIKEGCLVEVFKDADGFIPGWFSARVLTLKDGKAYVSYDDLLLEDGSGNLKEWVSVEGEGEKAPRIRFAYPQSGLHFRGTRKRHREAMEDYDWSLGDRVDALIKDCWCEGLLTEKNVKEEVTFTVHFPARGETSVFRAWQLRPSRFWKDGQWVEWSHSRGRSFSYQVDRPQEKRQKLGNLDFKATDKVSDIKHDLGKPEEPKLLALSASEKVFNVGRNSRKVNELEAPRTLRTGLQKGGSRVIFGIPKPGKKRKFMEVSKHYPSDKNSKNNETNDSAKFSKYLMPQATVPHRWRNASKVDSKEKYAAESKAKVPITRKPHVVPSRTMPRRANLANSVVSSRDDHSLMDHETGNEDSVGHENILEKSMLMEHPSSSGIEEATEGPLSSLFPHQVDRSPEKNSSFSRPERLGKRKIPTYSGKLTKIEEDKVYDGNSGKSVPGVVEPRRSNRRIQPTHRLLEGLQSALIISKLPSISHEKGHRSSRNLSGK
ncbi:hypothetical protein Nepgr_011385 [Nepenthes gracilis]|uniref:Agenet domain-containing protein n=1 Tax=Nepenthes gracilis TaxID=150966 RepID=A0AAD3SF89_NEPGR|nr:hypothetical protein Nepgr_011385 [Nepenthes gracilis]